MARYVRGQFVVSEPDTSNATECPECGFDAVVAFPIHVLTPHGVARFGDYVTCARCDDMEADS